MDIMVERNMGVLQRGKGGFGCSSTLASLQDLDFDPEVGGGAGSSGVAHTPGHAPHGHPLNPNGGGIETSGVGGGGAGANAPGGAAGGFGGQAPPPPMTGFEGLHNQPGAPLPPGAGLPTHNPVIVPVGARRRESDHGQPSVLNTVPTRWFDPNQQQQQYYPQQPWDNVNPSAYSSAPSGSGQYGAGEAASPNDPFATPAGQQGQPP